MTEHQVQSALINWWAIRCKFYRLPEFALFATPNGGNRNAATGAMLKREGVRRGIPDLMLSVPNKHYHGLFIEMKVGSNKPSKEQREVMQHLINKGYATAVCYDWKVAADLIDEYLQNI